jgi:glycosyltransferase involved in cell wall biosynthesis
VSRRVSVIIPAYNAAGFIRAALDSVCAQTVLPDEILVIDDGSTDGTAGEVADFGRTDLVRYIHQKNLGVSGARNAGLDLATGDWIAFLDADDVWLPPRLELALAVADRYPDLLWVGAASDEVPLTKPPVRRGASARALTMLVDGCVFENIFEVFHRDCLFLPLTMFLHRRCFEEVGRFDPGLLHREDVDLWVRIGLRYPRVGYVTEPLGRYIRRPESLTNRLAPMSTLDMVRHLRRRAGEVPNGERILRPYALWMTREACKVWLHQGARTELRAAFEEFPDWIPARWNASLRLLASLPAFAGKGLARLLRARLRVLGRSRAGPR